MSSDGRIRVGVIPGDCIGPEVVGVTLPLLEAAAGLDGTTIEFTHFAWGSEWYLERGEIMPADAAEQLAGFDGVLFGAVGDPRVHSGISSWGLILTLRQQLGLTVNLRPVRAWDGVPSPVRDAEGSDMVVVRENSEGEYVGIGGRVHPGRQNAAAIEVAVHTREMIESLAHYSFKLAQKRRSLVTVATKSNSLRHAFEFWDEVVAGVAESYPDVTVEYALIDSLCARVVQRPRSLDVIFGSNLFGDILSDLAAVLAGGLGMAPSANVAADGGVVGIYEPVHGSAPDIAGQGIANPVACVLSAAMLLDDCRCPAGAGALREAVATAVANPETRTADLSGTATTKECAAAIGSAMESVR
jgi:tartrate dehydrogenase/decarboxylase / D-malate dehydrogenase